MALVIFHAAEAILEACTGYDYLIDNTLAASTT